MDNLLIKENESLAHESCLSKPLIGHLTNLLTLFKSAFFRILSRFNIRKTIKEIKTLGKKHGPYFLAYAICIELLEDVAIPAALYSVGKPHLIPAALAFHCEPIAYPLYFAVASLMKRRG